MAVSGGLDSAVLLDVLNRLSSRRKWRIVVAHFNHQLRKGEADADEGFVERLTGRLRIPFRSGRGKVREFARGSGLSLEMAARQLRHEFFARTARELGIDVVATAHHADDQVELSLLRLLRGGGGGLSGMAWSNPSPVDNSVQIVRPFLDQSRNVLSRYASSHQLEFREDASNRNTDILRNRIRHELVPLMCKYQPAFVTNALRTMEIVGANEDFARSEGVKWLRRARKRPFTVLSPAVQRQIIRLQMLELGIVPGFEIVETLRQSPDRAVSASPVLQITCNKNGVLKEVAPGLHRFNPVQLELSLRESGGITEFNGMNFEWQIRTRPSWKRGTASSATSSREWFDAERVGDMVVLRHWQPGDRFQPIGMTAAVKLQDLFTNRKIPRTKRRNLVVAATRLGKIFWVEGLRIGEDFRLRPDTRSTLLWRWSPRKNDSPT